VQEADNQHNSNGKEPKAHVLKADQFLKLHVVLVDRLHVQFLGSDWLVDGVQLVNQFVDQLVVLLLWEQGNVAKLCD